jgi:hypothetical protein
MGKGGRERKCRGHKRGREKGRSVSKREDG